MVLEIGKRCLPCLLLFWFIIISKPSPAQDIAKDSSVTRDSTIRQKIGTLIQYVIKDTVPRTGTKKDSILEQKLEGHVYSFRQFEHETFLFAETPAKWHKKDWIRAGLVVVLTAAIIPFDQYISNITQGHQSNYYVVPVILGRIYGSWYLNVAVTAATLGYTIFSHNTSAEKIDVELFQAEIYSDVLTGILKVGIGRATPADNLGAFSFHPFTKSRKSFGSMPNSDACSAFALSTITYRHAKSTVFKILAYLPAAFTLFSEIYQNDHWASDEFLGAAMGFATGMWTVTLHEGKRHKINILANY